MELSPAVADYGNETGDYCRDLGTRMDRIPFRLSPMLATLVAAPFKKQGWAFEEKYDGVRILAYKEASRVTLVSRNAIDSTAKYMQIAQAVGKLKSRTIALDGEVIAADKKGVSRFQLLQRSEGKQQYAIFDCLYADGKDLRKQPLRERREILERCVKPDSVLLLSRRLSANGLDAFEIASQRGFEGIVGKNLASAYVERRSRDWLKVKVHQEDEFVIGGFTQPAGSRKHFGALLLGIYSGGKLRYVGKVGTGFAENTLSELHRKFSPYVTKTSPFSEPVKERGATFLSPKLVAQISFGEWTSDGRLRQPVYLGLREDKAPREVVLREG
jgi:bifunctional non-homologous end joining protein LigD